MRGSQRALSDWCLALSISRGGITPIFVVLAGCVQHAVYWAFLAHVEGRIAMQRAAPVPVEDRRTGAACHYGVVAAG